MRSTFLPLTLPNLGDAERAEVDGVLRSGWLTSGPLVARFEDMLRECTGAVDVVALCSCTAALHLSLLVAGVGPGSEVITTPLTWPATANVIENVGATPVFADVDPTTLNIDVRCVEKRLTARTKAVIPVHLAGRPADVGPLHELAAAHGFTVIEDGAHALGAAYRGRPIGSISRFTTFSFYATKNVTTGEGGALALNDRADAGRVRVLANNGMTHDTWQRVSESVPAWGCVAAGFKYTMSDINAALGVHQLPRLEEVNDRRRALASAYRKRLEEVPNVTLPSRPRDVTDAAHLFIVALHLEGLRIDRDRFREALRAENVGSGVHYRGLHLQPFYRDRYGLRPEDLPTATFLSERVVSLPLFPTMTDEDVATVVEAVEKLIDHYRR